MNIYQSYALSSKYFISRNRIIFTFSPPYHQLLFLSTYNFVKCVMNTHIYLIDTLSATYNVLHLSS